MQHKIVLYNGMEVECGDEFLKIVRHHFNKEPKEDVSELEISEFIKEAFSQAINKGYAEIEESKK